MRPKGALRMLVYYYIKIKGQNRLRPRARRPRGARRPNSGSPVLGKTAAQGARGLGIGRPSREHGPENTRHDPLLNHREPARTFPLGQQQCVS